MPNRLLRLSPWRGDEGVTHIFSHTAHNVLTPLCSSLADELPYREQEPFPWGYRGGGKPEAGI